MGYIAKLKLLCYNYDISHTGDGHMIDKTCCFFGHRNINETEELKSKIIEIIEKLIVKEKVEHFFSGVRADLIACAKKR